jgi:hypothetical protein
MEQEPNGSAEIDLSTEDLNQEEDRFLEQVSGILHLFEDALEQEDRDGNPDLTHLWMSMKALLLHVDEAEERTITYAAAMVGPRNWYQRFKGPGRTDPLCYVKFPYLAEATAISESRRCARKRGWRRVDSLQEHRPDDCKACRKRCPKPKKH